MSMRLFWHPDRAEVRFLSLTNRGTVGEGYVTSAEGKIILRGHSHRENQTAEFKTVLEIDAQGTLTDTFLRLEDGQLVPGHIQKYVAGEP